MLRKGLFILLLTLPLSAAAWDYSTSCRTYQGGMSCNTTDWRRMHYQRRPSVYESALGGYLLGRGIGSMLKGISRSRPRSRSYSYDYTTPVAPSYGSARSAEGYDDPFDGHFAD